MPGIIRLKCRQRIHAKVEVIEIERRDCLRKAFRAGGNDSERPGPGHKTQIGQVCETALRLVGNRSGSKEAQTRLIDSTRAKVLVIAHDELLRARWGNASKAR